MWEDSYTVVGVKPGVIYQPGVGYLDLSDKNLPEEQVRRAYELGCPYLRPKKAKATKAQEPQ